MELARNKGLQFIQSARDRMHVHANVNDKLYDSRSGLAVCYRYAPRNIYELCQEFNIKTPLIHSSVLRCSLDVTDGYAPGNLPKNGRFVAAGQAGFVHEYEYALLRQTMGNNNTLLKRVAGAVRLRMRLHTLFVQLSAIYVNLMIKRSSFSAVIEMASAPTSMTFLKSSAKVLLDSIWLFIPAVTVVWLSLSARRKIQNTFSSFWYGLNAKLSVAGVCRSVTPDDSRDLPTQLKPELTK